LSRPIKKVIDRPNIVVVMTDQHAARAIGVVGDPAADTPALDRLAARGTRFTNAYCPSPLCVPSRMAFLTGLEPHVSGVLSNDDFLASNIPTISHALGAGGYDCQLFGRMHFYGPDQLHGFAGRPIGDIGPGWPGAGAPEIGTLTEARGNHGDQIKGSGQGETSYQAYDHAVAESAVEGLKKLCAARDQADTPFFAMVSLFCPHPPYIALPEDCAAVSGNVGPPRLDTPEHRHPALQEWANAGGVARVIAKPSHRARIAYYGLVRMVDRLAGQVLAALEGRDDTIVAYVSDHGEALGERGLWWKSTFYDESSKVPMIFAGPGIEESRVDDRVTGLLDLSATILDLAGVPALPGQVGRSLASKDPWTHRVTSSYYGGLMNIKTKALRHRMLRQNSLKLCVYDGHAPQLFDLEADPDELCDIAPSRPEDVKRLSGDLTAGWDVETLTRTQKRNAARAELLRGWVKAVHPPERLRWCDPNPERNRYL